MDAHDTGLATVAGGCFWCLEAVFEQVEGVEKVVSGYSGGDVIQPTYRQVCSETTGHAEAVQITFDSEIISYDQILDIFFAIHDPTTLNRQGYDVGASYRSAIFFHSPEQKLAAENAIAAVDEAKTWSSAIVTEVTSLSGFYPAEDEHQQYYRKNNNAQYCQMIISPKLVKFRKEYLDKLKPAVST